MIKHLFIIALRNLLKYKQQTVISIVGLSIGFICFALSAYWIRYEMSFDSFHKNADRIYQVRKIDTNEEFGQYINTPPPLARTLEKYFPEIKVSSASTRRFDIEPGDNARSIEVQQVDDNFFDLFDVTILSGSFDFNDENGILVTKKFAQEYYHTDNPTGKELIWYVGGEEYKKLIVRGVVKDWPTNTNLPFQIIQPIEKSDRERWDQPGMTYILVNKATDIRALKKKFEGLKLKEVLENPSYLIVPLTKVYYTEPAYNNSSLKFEQVVLFAILGLLVIICALFNYLNLYASRIRIRVKELSLRKVNGASNMDLFILLTTEFILLIGMACILGFIGIKLCLPAFKTYAAIESDYIHIYTELGIYILLLIGVSLILAFLVIYFTRRRLFQESVRMVTSGQRKSIFSKMSLLLQMIISLGFITCTTIYYKQIYTLDNKNAGFNRENRLTLSISTKKSYGYADYFRNKTELNTIINGIKEIPTIENCIPLGQGAVLPRLISSRALARTEEMSKDELVDFDEFNVHPAYNSFYELQLLAGSDFKPSLTNSLTEVIINESMAKALGLKDPVGKTLIHTPKPFYLPDGKVYQNGVEYPCIIIGLVKDFVYESPIAKVSPVVMSCSESYIALGVKYKPDAYQQTKKAIETYIEKNLPDKQVYIFNTDDEYKKQYASEASLRMSLTLLSLVCIIISLFGIYSVVVLDCEYRRKEIAIRKVNGAPLSSIFYLFFREYVILLGVSALFSFPAGYLIMKPWTEKFILQTEINWWIYPLLFSLTFVVVVISIIGRIWHTVHINPSAELKKE